MGKYETPTCLEDLTEHSGLVYKIVLRKYGWVEKSPLRSRVDLGDLFQEGFLGMMHALVKFDPERGFKFSTYAEHWIKQRIRLFIDKNRSHLSVPVRVNEMATQGTRCMRVEPESNILDAQRALTVPTSLSTDYNPGEPDPDLDTMETEEEYAFLLKLLSERSADVVRARMNGATLQEIGSTLDVSRERVRQIEFKSFQELRDNCKQRGIL